MPNPRLRPGDPPRSIRYDTRTAANGKTVIRARAYISDDTGRRREKSATGSSRPAAKRALLARIAGEPVLDSVKITSKTRIRVVADEMFAEKTAAMKAGQLSPGTLRTYRSHWRNHIEPAMADRAIEWMTVQFCDQWLKKFRRGHTYALTKGVRSLLTEILDVAVRYDAISPNPVALAADIPGDGRRQPKVLTAAEAVEIWFGMKRLAAEPSEKVNNRRYRATMIHPMVPDIWLWSLGVGTRIAQTLAVHWPWIDLDKGTAKIGPAVIRGAEGEGLRLQEQTSKSHLIEVDLPEQVIAMLLARQQLPTYDPMGPVFPSATGGLLDPSNVSTKWIKPALRLVGRPNVSSHWARRTLATELNEAGLSLMDIAGRLGHSDTRTTEKHYARKRALNPAVVAATEAMLSAKPEKTVIPLGKGA